MLTCKCRLELTGRCWLRVDHIIHEKNTAMFNRHSESSLTRVYALATEELARLRDKRWQMEVIERIESYPSDGVEYCKRTILTGKKFCEE